ncbi:hypothetical protein HPB50_018058 [Hyalomma asiaticum]|uniref:Uncharacterized protein n=1 Tax=Hyalomma asiaticum TaxID=266040 RepID=A0ACB7TPJ3_HYAAI|nr:hypothetical protein HPB50_018058 [Hyalomma asiaticum]
MGGGHSSQHPPDGSEPMNASGEQENPALSSTDFAGLQTCGDLPVTTDVENVAVFPKKARTDIHEQDSDAAILDPAEDHSDMEVDGRTFATLLHPPDYSSEHVFAGLEVTSYVPQSYVRNLGKVMQVRIQYSEEQLLEYVKDSRVISVKERNEMAP